MSDIQFILLFLVTWQRVFNRSTRSSQPVHKQHYGKNLSSWHKPVDSLLVTIDAALVVVSDNCVGQSSNGIHCGTGILARFSDSILHECGSESIH